MALLYSQQWLKSVACEILFSLLHNLNTIPLIIASAAARSRLYVTYKRETSVIKHHINGLGKNNCLCLVEMCQIWLNISFVVVHIVRDDLRFVPVCIQWGQKSLRTLWLWFHFSFCWLNTNCLITVDYQYNK